MIMITADQLKAARKLLGWAQMTLALEANVALQTIAKFETGQSRPFVHTASTIKRTLERAGVEFPEGEPVRMRK